MAGDREYRAEVGRDGVRVEVVVGLDSRPAPFLDHVDELGEVVGVSAVRLAQQVARVLESKPPF